MWIVNSNISELYQDTLNISHIYCQLQSFQSCFNHAVTLYCKQCVCVWADTVTLGHLLLLRYIKRLLQRKKLPGPPWKTYSKVNQLTLLHPMCFPCMQLSSYHGNCIPEPNTHPSMIWNCLFDAQYVCVYVHTCVFVEPGTYYCR